MQLNTGAVDEFKNLYVETYGEKLTNELAIELGTRLVGLVRAVYGNNLPKIETKRNLTNGKQKDNNSVVLNSR